MPVALSWLWCAKQKPRRTLWSRSCVDLHYWHYNTQNYYYYYYYVIFLRGKAESWRVSACAHWQERLCGEELWRIGRDACVKELPKTLFSSAALELDSHWSKAVGRRHTQSCTLPYGISGTEINWRQTWRENVHRATCCKETDATRRRHGSSEGLKGSSGVPCLSVWSSAKMDSKRFKCRAQDSLLFMSTADESGSLGFQPHGLLSMWRLKQ